MRELLLLAGALAGLMPAPWARAEPVPVLASVSREWFQRGGETNITLSGSNFAGVVRLHFGGEPGVTAMLRSDAAPAAKIEASGGGITTADQSSDRRLSAVLKVDPQAALGARELRVITTNGVSNPLTIQVSHLPESLEEGRINSTNTAQRIEPPAAVTGKIGAAAESDYYRFTGRKGESLLLEIYAFRIGSALDSSLTVLDAAGKELARNEDAYGFDSFINFKAPEDGDYFVQVRDFRYEGGGNHGYRLWFGRLPHVTSVYPLGARRGQMVEVEMKGENLDGAGRMTLQIAPDAPVGAQAIRAITAAGVSNPFSFDVTDLPEISETEPNNATNNATAITPGVMINGRIQAEKDVDLYKFKSASDQRLIIEVMARRFASPLDALVQVTDAEGKSVQQNDDAEGADARIDFDKFRKDQEYFISLRDLLQRGGENFAYRLSVRPPQPSFNVRVLTDAVPIRRGGHAAVRCNLTRNMGFNETVRVGLETAPPGITCEPLIFTPKSPAVGFLMLTASADAALGSTPLAFSAGAVGAGRGNAPGTVEPFANNRVVKEAFLTVLPEPPFSVEISTLSAALEQGQSTNLEVFVRRAAGFTGEIKLTTEGFPGSTEPITRSFDVATATLKDLEARAVMALKARSDSETGTRPIVVKGEARVRGVLLSGYSRAIPVTVNQIPFTLSSTLSKLSVTVVPAGVTSAANEAQFAVKADRRAGFKGEISLVLEGLPEGVTVQIEKIAAAATEATVKLTATDKAAPGKAVKFTVTGTGSFNDRTYRQKTGEISLAITAPEEPPKVAGAPGGKEKE